MTGRASLPVALAHHLQVVLLQLGTKHGVFILQLLDLADVREQGGGIVPCTLGSWVPHPAPTLALTCCLRSSLSTCSRSASLKVSCMRWLVWRSSRM